MTPSIMALCTMVLSITILVIKTVGITLSSVVTCNLCASSDTFTVI
jgi:hypothetical protein